jgi:putative acetyltransferase
MQIEVRAETPQDHDQVRRVNELGFGKPGEAKLVDALRKVAPHISLVAAEGPTVVGHIFFSPVRVESPAGDFPAIALGPMAVLPSHQNREIGSRLVRAGLEECRHRGHEIAVVLGHPRFYPRFGFVPAPRVGLRYEHPVPDEVFMALEMRPGALAGRGGVVRYHPEFSKVEVQRPRRSRGPMP